MRKENNIVRHHNNNNKKRVVKNENYYAYKKKSLIKKSVITGSTLAVIGVCWYTKEIPVKAEMIINNNTIEWTTKKDKLKGVTFQIFKNGEIISETDKFEFIDENQVDKVAPNQINEIKTYRGINNFKILWQEPLDTGSNDIYQVFAVNKHGRKIFKTDEVESSFSSGISKYKVKFNNEEFETEKAEFSIDINDLKDEQYTIEIKSIDKEGNESEFKKFNFKFDKLEFDIVDNKLVPKNSLYTNTDYNFYIVDKSLVDDNKEIAQYDKKMFLLNQDIFNVLSDGTKPTMSTPSYNIKNNALNLNWSNTDKKSDYSFYVEAVNKVTFDKIYSDLIDVSGSSKVMGYHYCLNTDKDYEILSTDNYVESNSLSIDTSNLDKNKKYYFHIAKMDNNGLLSDTKTITIDLNKKSSLVDAQNILKKIVTKMAGTTTDEYFKVINSIAKNFSLDKVEALEKMNIKIHIIKDDDFKNYLKETYNIDASSDTCVKSGNSIYFNISKSTSALNELISSLLK